MNSAQKVGRIIKDNRLKKKLTQKELAKLLFVEESTISRWECGLGYPSTALFEPICNILGITLHHLLGSQNEVNANKRLLLENLITLVLSSVIFAFLFFKKNADSFFIFSNNHLFINIFLIVIQSFVFALNTMVIIFFILRKKIIILQIFSFSLSLISVISLLFIAFSSEYTAYFSLLIMMCTIYLSIAYSYLLKTFGINVLKSRKEIIEWLFFGLFYIPLAFLFYISSIAMSLSLFHPILWVFYYIYSVLFNMIPILYFYKRFHKKFLLLVLMITFLFFNATYILNIIFQKINFLLNVFIYLGLVNTPFIWRLLIDISNKGENYVN